VIYELHVGTFTPEGTFAAAKNRLDYLVELGITAVELMPIAEFPGGRNWGYDGVLLFAPDSAYGTPDELKDFIQTAHAKGLMVFLDVVYNHFGPEGNYLHMYAPQFFTDRHHTPWGSAINFDSPGSPIVRNFYIHNTLYWLEEYHFDGLRLDAVHAILDDSQPDILEELAERVRNGPGAERHIHLVLENDNNAAHYLRPDTKRKTAVYYNAQWNDDIHHVLHCLLTDEFSGYYQDYRKRPIVHLARCLIEGFAYQGEVSAYREGKHRGEPSADLPPTAFVSFLQNHDQVGNRALGERITELCEPQALRAATSLLLLAPPPPLLFMGQEWATTQRFTYFVDFHDDLGEKVTEGRLKEFSKFPEFASREGRRKIPPPNEKATFIHTKLPWGELERSEHQQWLALHRRLLQYRHQEIHPRLQNLKSNQTTYDVAGERSLKVDWHLADATLTLLANLGASPQAMNWQPSGRLLFTTHEDSMRQQLQDQTLEPWTVAWFLQE
jgi:malto-oligosyltrehalose trehalohydrolase